MANHKISKQKRWKIFNRDDWRCVYIDPSSKKRCPVAGSPEDHSMLTIEHIVPFSVSRDNSLENLETMCGPHNHLRAREFSRDAYRITTRRILRGEQRPRGTRVIDLVPGAWIVEEMHRIRMASTNRCQGCGVQHAGTSCPRCDLTREG